MSLGWLRWRGGGGVVGFRASGKVRMVALGALGLGCTVFELGGAGTGSRGLFELRAVRTCM